MTDVMRPAAPFACGSSGFVLVIAVLMTALQGCASAPSTSRDTGAQSWRAPVAQSSRGHTAQRAASAGPRQKVGAPYTVRGKVYVPRHEPNYDRVGTASWYGPGFHGKATASGERFDMNGLTAAHKTLPIPSLVEVVNLESNRRLILRVNDRGPFIDNRMIDLSKRSADLLGFTHSGTASVRVRYIGPAPQAGDDTLERRTAAVIEHGAPATRPARRFSWFR